MREIRVMATDIIEFEEFSEQFVKFANVFDKIADVLFFVFEEFGTTEEISELLKTAVDHVFEELKNLA